MRSLLLRLFLWWCGYRWVWGAGLRDIKNLPVGTFVERRWSSVDDWQPGAISQIDPSTVMPYRISNCQWVRLREHGDLWRCIEPMAQRYLIHKDNIKRAVKGDVVTRWRPV